MRPLSRPSATVVLRSHLHALPRSTTFLGRPTRAYISASPRRCKSVSHAPRAMPAMATTEPGKQPDAKQLAQLYGGSYLGTSIAMSIVSYAVLYALVYVGVDVRSFTNTVGTWLAATPLGRPAALDSVSDAASAAAIAYVAHKVTSPLRFPLTVAATPFVARFFSKDQGSGDADPPTDSS